MEHGSNGGDELAVRVLAHELRTPLTTILGYLQLLQREERLRDVDTLRDSLALVYSKARDLAGVVERMTDYADPAAAFESSMLERLTHAHGQTDLVRLLGEIVRERPVRLVVDPEAVAVPVDVDALRVAAGELIDNALRFGRPGAEALVQVSLARSGRPDESLRLVLRVTNQSDSIPSDLRDSIFEPFHFSRDHMTAVNEGMGLGLTVARRSVEAADGTLTLESGTPTTFRLELPVTDDPIASRLRVMNARAALAEIEALGAVDALEHQVEEAITVDPRLAQELIEARGRQLKAIEDFRSAHRQAMDLAGRLDRAYLEVIAAMARAVEARDKYTGTHVERVGYHSLRIARALGITGEALRHLEFGAVLHDVGKIGVPDAVLGKPGALTPGEWETMRRHPEIGCHVLEGIGFLSPALGAVESHHERWDGRGYPRGIQGEQIPLAGRIVAVADAFDAMTSDRPYRTGMSREVALAEIRRGRGTHFDPDVVDAFLSTLAA